MINDRIALLELELAKKKMTAAELYFKIAISEEVSIDDEYQSLKIAIVSIEQDLENARQWVKQNKEH